MVDSGVAPLVVISTVEDALALPPSISAPNDGTSPTVLSLSVAEGPATFQCPSRVVGVLGDGYDADDFAWQKAASLVEDGWTTVKKKKVKSSTPTFDMALRSQMVGTKGKS